MGWIIFKTWWFNGVLQILKNLNNLFGGKFKNYLGSTYDIFQDKSIIPWLRYKPAAEAVENAKTLFKDSATEARG